MPTLVVIVGPITSGKSTVAGGLGECFRTCGRRVAVLDLDLAGLVRPGGAVAHSERMPWADLPRLRPSLAEIEQQPAAGSDDRRARWDAWWEQASRDPALQPAVTQRHAVFETGYPTEEFSPPAAWHIAALTDAGFAEAGLVWRSGPAAIIAAVR